MLADKGSLKVQCFNGDSYIPVSGIKVYVNKSELAEDNATGIELTTNTIGFDRSSKFRFTSYRIFIKP